MDGEGNGTWRVSRQSGEFEPIVDGTNGFILQTNARALIGYGGTLFVSGSGAISRLDPRPLPTSVPFRMNPAQTSQWTTIGVGPNSIGYGSIESGAEGTLGMAIYTNRQNGTVISEMSVPMSPLVREGRIYASVQGPINTGLAIANPGDAVANISFYFTDANGNDFGAGSFTIPPHQQIAKFLDEAPFGGARSIQGTFTFKSSAPIGAVALRGLTNERSEFLMTTLPIAPLSLSWREFADDSSSIRCRRWLDDGSNTREPDRRPNLRNAGFSEEYCVHNSSAYFTSVYICQRFINHHRCNNCHSLNWWCADHRWNVLIQGPWCDCHVGRRA